MEIGTKKPPKLFRSILRRVSDSTSKLSVAGDLEEEFNMRAVQDGLGRTFFWYIRQIFILISVFIYGSIYWSSIMFRNYLKIAMRNIQRYKGYSFINISGLAIGIACCILIFLYVQEELNYDNYHKDKDRIYRVAMHFESKSLTIDFATVGPPVQIVLKRDFPQVEFAARIQGRDRPIVKCGDRLFHESRFFYADNELFDILTFVFLKGSPENALVRPQSAVISKRMAEKYFGDEDPLGKIININSEEFQITGVIANSPSNTHLKCDILISFKSLKVDRDMGNAWGWTSFHTYIKLGENVNAVDFGGQIRKIENKYAPEREFKNNYYLQPLTDIHLHSRLAGETERPGNLLNIYITCTIGFLILLIACINFMNLTTARFSTRIKEIGIRKVVGADRRQLIAQFLGESVLFSFFSFFLAIIIAGISLPLLNDISNKAFVFKDFLKPGVFGAALLIILFTGFASGSYPSFFLSVFKPSGVLRKGSGLSIKGSLFRKVLVVIQFSVSIFLLIGTFVVYRQLNFMRNSYLGFEKEQKLIVRINLDYLQDFSYEGIKTEFLGYSQITNAAVSSGIPGRGVGGWTTLLSGVEDDKAQVMSYLFIDQDFLGVYKIELSAGRNFNKELTGDVDNSFILNEAAVTAFGWKTPAEALEKEIETGYGVKGMIIGVVSDFHYSGLQREIRPLVIGFCPGSGLDYFNTPGFLTMTLNTADMNTSIDVIKDKWQEFHPDVPFQYYFVDSIFDGFYRAEERTRTIFSIFTSLGLFIACLGLFGLASFTAEQRTKEIAIRKVLGASLSGIIVLLSREFLKWIIIANIISWPAAYFLMNRWLQNFSYRINPELRLFMLAGILAFFIALLTVSYQAFKAATANSVKSLKHE